MPEMPSGNAFPHDNAESDNYDSGSMSHETNLVKAARLWLLQRKGPRNVNLEGGNTRTAARLLAALAALAVNSSDGSR